MTHHEPGRESAMAHAPVVGARVVTRDGEEMGTVKATTPDAFHVDVPHARDYWLSNTLVLPRESDSTSAITIDCDAGEVDAYKLTEPAPVVADSPVADEAGDQFHDSAERAQKRHDMERGGSSR